MDNSRLDSTPTLTSALRQVGVIPVVTLETGATARRLVDVLLDAGLTHIEITLRTPAGLEGIAQAASSPAIVGAGTVTSARLAEDAIEAGADFIVSPGFDAAVVRACEAARTPVLPGIATPTELMRARAMGLQAVKVFPASSLGGPTFVRALASVWPDACFVPTGGITAENAGEYLELASVAAVGGSWMVPPALVREGAWDQVSDLARTASSLRR